MILLIFFIYINFINFDITNNFKTTPLLAIVMTFFFLLMGEKEYGHYSEHIQKSLQ